MTDERASEVAGPRSRLARWGMSAPQIDPRVVIQELQRAMSPDASPEEAERAMRLADELFAAHQDRVYAVCYRFVGDPQRACELAQDALLVAYTRLPEFRGEARFSTWLYAICRNICWRALEKRSDVLMDHAMPEEPDPTPSVLAGLRREERVELLREASRAVLDPIEQEAVELRYAQNMPLAQIEVMLELDSRSGARGLLQRCKRKLERELRRLLDERDLRSSFVRGTVTS